jgi:NarL family two-component system sensor histidine kinase LiaS
MGNNSSLSKGYQQLRWKLTLSYTAVTVGALLTVELVLLVGLSLLLITLLNSGFLPAQLIEASTSSFAPTLRFYLAQTPPDQDGITQWLEQVGAAYSANLPLSFDATDEMFVVGADGRLLAARPPGLLGSSAVGQQVDAQVVPGLADPLRAALAGEENVDRLYSLGQPGGKFVMTVPIWDAGHEQVLGVLAGIAVVPTVGSLLRDVLPILGVSLLIFMLIAAVAGTLFGYLAARQPVHRLNQLSEATLAWSQGDFSTLVDDASGDALGQLSRRLNDMTLQLEQLIETRRELAMVEERNRLARELHDSAKQQAFAAAAQVSGVRTLLKRDPEAAEAHLEEAERLIYELRQELTSLILELRPAALGDKGLASALRDYAADWSRQNEIACNVRIQGERFLPLEVEQPLFRITQEALANAARHSGAKAVEIALSYANGDVSLTISDDGDGFDVGSSHKGYGLKSMRERVDSLGGALSIDSELGQGTSISCTVPVSKPVEDGQEKPHE